MKDQALKSIDEKLVKTGHFLEEIICDPAKSECLKAFRDCQDIIVWLREFTKSKVVLNVNYNII